MITKKTSRKLRIWPLRTDVLLLIYCSILLAGQADSVTAAPPLAVGLISFTASPMDTAVRLQWETGTEQNTAGFKIKRASDSATVFLMPADVEALNSEQIEPFPPEGHAFIWSKGTPATGAIYIIADRSVVNGLTYTYSLIEVESDSNEMELSSVTVTAGLPTDTPTSTPVVIEDDPSGTDVADDPAQKTPSATRTLRPTATPLPTATVTAASTATSRAVTTPTDAASGTNSPPFATAFPTLSTSIGSEPLAAGTATPYILNGSDPDQATLSADQVSEFETVQIAAQGEPEATPPEGYPGPTQSASPDDADGVFPPSPTSIAPYPAGTGAMMATPVPIIGSQQGQAQPTPIADTTPNQVLLGRIYLWGAFIIAALIFITAVIGSIILFTRKRI
jgi:hypothetical protein